MYQDIVLCRLVHANSFIGRHLNKQYDGRQSTSYNNYNIAQYGKLKPLFANIRLHRKRKLAVVKLKSQQPINNVDFL